MEGEPPIRERHRRRAGNASTRQVAQCRVRNGAAVAKRRQPCRRVRASQQKLDGRDCVQPAQWCGKQ
eukprot:3858940-Prymnesium_polylepis.1